MRPCLYFARSTGRSVAWNAKCRMLGASVDEWQKWVAIFDHWDRFDHANAWNLLQSGLGDDAPHATWFEGEGPAVIRGTIRRRWLRGLRGDSTDWRGGRMRQFLLHLGRAWRRSGVASAIPRSSQRGFIVAIRAARVASSETPTSPDGWKSRDAWRRSGRSFDSASMSTSGAALPSGRSSL